MKGTQTQPRNRIFFPLLRGTWLWHSLCLKDLWNVFVGLELCFPLTLSLCLTLVLVSLNASCIHLLSSTLYHPPPSPHPQLLTQHVAYSLRPSTQQRSWALLKACCMKASGDPNSLAHQCKVTDLSSSYWLCHLHKRTNLNKERC